MKISHERRLGLYEFAKYLLFTLTILGFIYWCMDPRATSTRIGVTHVEHR